MDYNDFDIRFPQYRRYTNNTTYFKVLSHSEWEEISVIGRYYRSVIFSAKILPDRNFISDMLSLEGGRWEAVSEHEYENFVNHCTQHYKKAP